MTRAPVRPTTRARGAASEELAARYLEREGYQIIARNFSTAGGELDLVARDGDVLCFVEVRSRQDDAHGDPLETIDRRKRRRIIHAARAYLEALAQPWPEMRFDAVGIVLSDPPRVTLVRDAFEVGE